MAMEERDLDLVEVRAAFVIDTLDKAIEVMDQIKSLTDNQGEIIAAAKAKIDRVSEWRDDEVNRLQSNIDWLSSYLEQYHRTIFEADPRKKTISTPFGKLTIRKVQPAFERDNEAMVKWLKKNKLKELIETKDTARWGELKKLVTILEDGATVLYNGNPVDGVTVVQPDEPNKFSVEVN
jgi:phage host-nuclease inhibitor protein Gam